jgi:uncharacterized pyridoxamine 5'-phosphate oxidase family protein/Pyruvate/2-oxoacid:ferredoxin oxidoreductase delta subunit
MDQIAEKALNLLREVKSVAFATVDNGEPAVRIANVMLVQKDGLYFLTARGKPFYGQLEKNKKVAICGMDKSYVTVRVVGDIRLCDARNIVDKIFDHEPRMNGLYPGKKRNILEAFHMHRGKGEIFYLAAKSLKGERFAFGGEIVNPSGYRITDKCSACEMCVDACPVGVISEGEVYIIDGSRCLECGSCAEICPEDAIESSQGF